MRSLRQRVAARTPGVIRKCVRMAGHYLRRHREWIDVLREMRGADRASRLTLLRSALLAPLTSLRRLDGFEPPLLLADADLVVEGVGRFSTRAGTDDIIHVLTAREPIVRRELENRLKPGDTFVDAGANIGFYSIMAAGLVGPRGRVIAIEMMPPTAARLRHHVSLNDAAVTVIESALSDRDGDLVVATSRADKYGQASIVAGAGDRDRSVRHEVRTVRLDTALADVNEIALMKMDLEGAEFLALSGGTDILRRTRALLFESNSRDDRVFGLLAGLGFSVAPCGGNDYLATRIQVRGDR